MEDTLGFQDYYCDSFEDRSALLSFVNEHIGCGLWVETFTVLSGKSLWSVNINLLAYIVTMFGAQCLDSSRIL